MNRREARRLKSGGSKTMYEGEQGKRSLVWPKDPSKKNGRRDRREI